MDYIDELMKSAKSSNQHSPETTGAMKEDELIRKISLSKFISAHSEYFEKYPDDSSESLV